MTEIKLKRVYDQQEEQDGYRILVDKLWPRGIKKEDLHYDLWAKDIAPSTPLRTWYHQDKDNNWDLFSKKYLLELEQSSTMKSLIDTIKNKDTVTLLFASKNAIENHALILQKYLQQKLN